MSSIVPDRSEDDPHLHYLDGRVLFGEADVRYLPDGLHPDTGRYALMGVRMTDLIQRWLPTHRARSSPQVG
jgi:hypothetical protein